MSKTEELHVCHAQSSNNKSNCPGQEDFLTDERPLANWFNQFCEISLFLFEQVLKENRLVKCTVGTSGRIKSCQLILPPLQKISRIIKAKYYKATRVIATKRDRKKSYYLRTVGSSRNHGRPKSKKPKKSSLVYFSQSPSYCYRQDQYSIPGTRGRQCQRNTHKEDDCTFMCCGRGYKREAKFQKRFCHCKASADEPCSCKICTDVIIENKCL